MIVDFKHKGLERFFRTGANKGIPAASAARIDRMLDLLDQIVIAPEADIPGYGFHRLTGDRKGTYSIKVTGNWRITFQFDGENVTDVDLEDYH